MPPLKNSEAPIVADLSNDSTYAEVLHEMFGQRVVGVQLVALTMA
jgi:hypothetical protein